MVAGGAPIILSGLATVVPNSLIVRAASSTVIRGLSRSALTNWMSFGSPDPHWS